MPTEKKYAFCYVPLRPFFVRAVLALAVLLVPALGISQDSLSLSQAIENALRNNPDILVTRADYQSAALDNSAGNAGMLPVVDVTGGYDRSSLNTNQEYNNNTSVKRSGAVTSGLSAGAHLNWTLFDGLKMFATKSRLNAAEEASGFALQVQLENSVIAVISNYFLAVNYKEKISVLDSTLVSQEERVRIADTRYQAGLGSKLEFLQAQVDRNALRSEKLKLQVSLTAAQTELNRLMGAEIAASYLLTDTVSLNYHPTLADLEKSVPGKNFEIKTVQLQQVIAEKSVAEYRSARMPSLNVHVDYNFAENKNDVGYLLYNRYHGLYTGIGLRWILFDGNNISREIQKSKLQVQQASWMLTDTRKRVEEQLYIAYKNYEMNLEILDLETENAAVATQNLHVALEAYKVGSISGIALRESQDSYQESLSRLADARYQAKISEATLMKLNGDLVRQ